MTLPNFQVIGDVTHLTAIVLLPMKLQWSMDASGVSLTTQELYLLVFLTRYLGLFVYSVSLYNSAMKILFVSYTAMTIAMLRFQPSLKASCEQSGSSSEGSFRPWLHAIFPSLILATIVCLWDFGFEMHGFSSFQAFWWTFSEILEPLAIVPQLLVLRRFRNTAGVVTWCYVPLMAVYRALYILAWMQTMRDEPRCAHQYLLYFAALTQTFIYVLFFADRFYHRRDRDRRAPIEIDGGAMEIEAGFYGARQRLLPYFSSSPASFTSAFSSSSDWGSGGGGCSSVHFGVASKDAQDRQHESRRRDEEWA